MPSNKITIKGARVHNLKNINIDIPKNKFVVITGLSGSGKSSLAFDTIYAEGQRRYVESLSSYARQFLGVMDKPDVDQIEGLSPAISIDQKSASHNPRSTVGTTTDIYDYLRLIYAKAGRPHCPDCKGEVKKQSIPQVIEKITKLPLSENFMILAPVIKGKKGVHKNTLKAIERAGYDQVRINGSLYPLSEAKYLKLDKHLSHNIDVVVALLYIDNGWQKNLKNIIETALDLGNGSLIVYEYKKDKEITFSENLSCPKCGVSIPDIELRSFSFNSPYGACEACSGLGTKLEVEPRLIITNPKLTIAQGAIKPWTRIASGGNLNIKILKQVSKKHGFSVDVPVSELSKKHLEIIMHGTGEELFIVGNNSYKFEGVIPGLEKKYKETDSDYIRKEIENYMRVLTCPDCSGKRLKPEVLAVTLGGLSIDEIVNYSIENLNEFFNEITKEKSKLIPKGDQLNSLEKHIAKKIIKEILDRLEALNNVGLGYLNLDRTIMSLSGGEAQRIKLATQIGSRLTGVIYILDEPSVGLHARDNEKLINTLKSLRDIGNSVIVVEHDETTMLSADRLIDIGPGAGRYGGEVIAEGTPNEVKKNKNSLTGDYLSGKKKIEIPKKYRKGNGKNIIIKGANEFNLKNVDAKIPLGKLVCVTGVSGSGKSTLITEILSKALSMKFYRSKDLPGKHKEIKGLENLNKVITIDQSPIGRTPRSNPATYTGLFTYIRDLFTETPEAKIRGYDAGKFSFNVKGGGRCENCSGEGAVKIEMQFMPDVYVECEECHGKRYQADTLEIFYKGKNIADILEMPVAQAKEFFKDIAIIHEKLQILDDVGLGYIHLGQSATTLSGGEAQRVKLATELSRRSTGKTLYILDEPTTGLHMEDTKKLLTVLNQLVDKGNSVLIIEHNMDVIKCADWIIDLGPEGGDKGGKIVAQGTPQAIVKFKKGFTAKYLEKSL